MAIDDRLLSVNFDAQRCDIEDLEQQVDQTDEAN
jgi:hypothetical protein